MSGFAPKIALINCFCRPKIANENVPMNAKRDISQSRMGSTMRGGITRESPARMIGLENSKSRRTMRDLKDEYGKSPARDFLDKKKLQQSQMVSENGKISVIFSFDKFCPTSLLFIISFLSSSFFEFLLNFDSKR